MGKNVVDRVMLLKLSTTPTFTATLQVIPSNFGSSNYGIIMSQEQLGELDIDTSVFKSNITGARILSLHGR